MLIFNDCTETGYLSNKDNSKGGTIYIEVRLQYASDATISEIDKIVDMLDHSLITDNKEAIQFSMRYFLLEETTNVRSDIASVLKFMLRKYEEVDSIKVTLGKISYDEKIHLNK